MYPTVMVWGHGHFFKGGVETGEMINKHNGRHQPAKNSADKVWRCWTLIFAARLLDDNSFCSFQDLICHFNISSGGWVGGAGGGGERGTVSFTRDSMLHLATHTPGTRGLGDERTKSKQTNFKQTAILKGEETAESDETRYLWKSFNSLK